MKTRLTDYWRDILWQASGSSLAQIVGIAGIPILTRMYTPQDFAIQSLFIQVVTFLTALATWRYEYFVQLPKENEDAQSLNMLVIVFGFLSILILTPIIWHHREKLAMQLGNHSLAPWLFLAPVTAALVSWAIALQNNAQRFRDFKISGLSELVGRIFYISSGIGGALIQAGSIGLITTTSIAAIGKSAFAYWSQPAPRRKLFKTNMIDMNRLRKQYGKLATSTVISHLLTTSSAALAQISMARFYGPDVLGQFALVVATIYLPSGLLGAAIGQVYYQRAAQIWAEGKPFIKLWRGTALKLIIIGTPTYTVIHLLSDFAYPKIFGSKWDLSGEIASVMAAAAFFSFISAPMDRTCLVVGAWSYSILWSIFRLGTTAAITLFAWFYELTPMGYITALTTQMCLAYGIDLWMSYRFSKGQTRYIDSAHRVIS